MNLLPSGNSKPGARSSGSPWHKLKAWAEGLRASPETGKANSPERHDRRLLWGLAVLLVILLLWAAWAPIDRIVRAEGRIISSARAQIVQNLEGGIVTEIAVREGVEVKAGQVLMRLSPVQANSSLQQGQTRVGALKAQQARLRAEADGSGSITFGADIPEAYQTLERNTFRERASRMGMEQSALRQQIAQRQAELIEAQSRARSLTTELELARRQSVMMDGLVKRGAASQMELLEAQGRTERLTTTYSEAVSSIPRLQSAIGETSARLSESTARLRADARTELAQVSSEIDRLGFLVGGDSDRLARTEVRAPASGYINRLYFNTIGGVAKAGDPLLEITPSESPLAVEARVRPDDRASLRAGLPARVMLGAYDYTVYGALDGRVMEVSADTLTDERGGRYYRVVVETTRATGRLANEVLLPGMTARADVILGQRSVMSYLLSPLLRFSQNALREPT